MSIANEITRIANAKNALKEVAISRGVQISDTARISDYPQIFTDLPYVIKGTFTPEEDVNTFEIQGLNFSPECVLLSCVDAGNTAVVNGVYAASLFRNEFSCVAFWRSETASAAATISPQSSLVSWNNSGVQLKFAASTSVCFKKGYTYNFVISGGKS